MKELASDVFALPSGLEGIPEVPYLQAKLEAWDGDQGEHEVLTSQLSFLRNR